MKVAQQLAPFTNSHFSIMGQSHLCDPECKCGRIRFDYSY
ncbi:hypothetical protein A2U01_0047376, partial [Trifolium medium]|nr:hypothetical protein [Trifolium medium]